MKNQNQKKNKIEKKYSCFIFSIVHCWRFYCFSIVWYSFQGKDAFEASMCTSKRRFVVLHKTLRWDPIRPPQRHVCLINALFEFSDDWPAGFDEKCARQSGFGVRQIRQILRVSQIIFKNLGLNFFSWNWFRSIFDIFQLNLNCIKGNFWSVIIM